MATIGELSATIQTGPQVGRADGDLTFLRGGKSGEVVTSDFNGRYYEQTMRGNMFIYCSTAATLKLAATTGLVPTVWNPMGSNFNFIPVKLAIGFVSGTTVIGGVLWGLTANAGSTISATAPIVTFTKVAARNALIGGRASQMWFAPTTCTFVAAQTVIGSTGINLGAAFPTVANPAVADFDGSLILTPGNALSVCYSVTTTTALLWTALWGLELPV